MFALSSVLQMPLFLVYPKCGNSGVRKELNRLIIPRVQKSASIGHIMWCSTRRDISEIHWVPNPFVCALLIKQKGKVDEKMMKMECREANAMHVVNVDVGEGENAHNGQAVDARDSCETGLTSHMSINQENLLGKYVVVAVYDNTPHPSIVIDTDANDVQGVHAQSSREQAPTMQLNHPCGNRSWNLSVHAKMI